MELVTAGTLDLRGDTGPAFQVRVVVTDEPRLTIIVGDETLGDWDTARIGISALNRGFAVRAEGEEFTLVTDDDAGIATVLGLATASPRLARKVAASHPPQERPLQEPVPLRSNLGAIAFSLAGILVWTGGFAMRGLTPPTSSTQGSGIFPFWLVFLLGGVVMAGLGWIASSGRGWVRGAGLVAVGVLAVVFVLAASAYQVDVNELFSFGAIAGGLVVAVAVLFSGGLTQKE